MSVGCAWHILVPAGSLTAEHLIRAVELLRTKGLVPQRVAGNTIWMLTADGTGTVGFHEVSSASSWLASEGGLISFVGEADADELSLSVHHADGVLATELSGFGDSPAFDEVQLDISARTATDRGAAWGAFDADVPLVGELLGAVFAWCIDDEALEATGEISVHGAVSEGHVPTLRASAMAVPRHSPLAGQLHELAEHGHGALWPRHGWWELRAESGLCPGLREARRTVSDARGDG